MQNECEAKRIGIWRTVASRFRRRSLEKLCHQLNVITARRLIEDGMRHLVVYAFDGNSNVINVYGFPEREVIDLVFRYLCEKDLIRGSALDVGANVGVFTLLMAWQVGSAGHVVAFECEPRIHQLLRENIAMNYASWVELRPQAAGDRHRATH